MNRVENNYTAENIKSISDLEHIKLRPNLYVGDRLQNPFHLLLEVLDNAMDEVHMGFSDRAEIYIDKINSEHVYKVVDYGRGIPHGLKVNPDTGAETEVVELLFTKLNSGGKFDKKAYEYASGLHGQGSCIVNALSKEVTVKSVRDGQAVTVNFDNSQKTDLKYEKVSMSTPSGTSVTFIASDEFFETTEVDINWVYNRVKLLNSFGLRVDLYIDNIKQDLGIHSLTDLLADDTKENILYQYPEINVTAKKTGEKAKVAIQYTSGTSDKWTGYTNLIHNPDGGTHINCLWYAVIKAWRWYYDKVKKQLNLEELKDKDFLLGLQTICGVTMSDTKFNGQTKERLTVHKSRLEPLFDEFALAFWKHLKNHPDESNALLKRFNQYRLSQNKLSSAKTLVNVVKMGEVSSNGKIRRYSVVDKLLDCMSPQLKDTELFVCEGDSACYEENSRILLADGRIITLKMLYDEYINEGKTNYVYGYKEGLFIPALATNFSRKLSTNMVKVTFDDYSTSIVTKDHQWLMTNQDYIEVENSSFENSLMFASYDFMGFKQQYLTINGQCIYKNAARYYHGERPDKQTIVHHFDFDKNNNEPENLVYMNNRDHSKLHSQIEENSFGQRHKNKMINDPEYRERMNEANKQHWQSYWRQDSHRVEQKKRLKNKADDKYKEKISALTSIGMKKFTRDEWTEMRQSQRTTVTLSTLKDIIVYRQWETFETILEISEERWLEVKRLLAKEKGIKKLPMSMSYENLVKLLSEPNIVDLINNSNHRIIKIEPYTDSYVIEFTVADTSNYLMTDGLISHNCGPIKRARDKMFQACLPLRGKILNVSGMTEKDAIKSEEIKNIVNSIGCGLGQLCDHTKARYERVVYAGDADADGQQITNLVISAFVNLMPEFVKAGKLYVVKTPLYVYYQGKKCVGTDNIDEIPKGVNWARLKGLGELEQSEVLSYIIKPQTRTLLQIQYPSDIDKFNEIMGTSSGKSDLLSDLGLVVKK